MADWRGRALRRMLVSAERLSERAILLGSVSAKTPRSRSSALLSLVTRPDQYFFFMDYHLINARYWDRTSDPLPVKQSKPLTRQVYHEGKPCFKAVRMTFTDGKLCFSFSRFLVVKINSKRILLSHQHF